MAQHRPVVSDGVSSPGRELGSSARRTSVAFLVLLATVVSFGLGGAVLSAAAGGFGTAKPTLPAAALAIAALVLARCDQSLRGTRAALVVVLGFCVGAFYFVPGAVIRALDLPLQDALLHDLDSMLFGWLVPDGQLAVWIDGSALIGPDTLPGRILTEVLQLVYFSYFFWGPALLFLLFLRLWRSNSDKSWTRVRAYLCAWLGAFIINCGFYVIVPAVGPALAYAADFDHPLVGVALTTSIRASIASVQITPDCFPSGHTALSWIIAIVALRLSPRFGRWALAAAVVITLATVPLRYHYLVDIVAAIPLVIVGLWWGGFLRPSDDLADGHRRHRPGV